MNSHRYLIFPLIILNLSCSIPTFVAIANFSKEKIEIIFYLKKSSNESISKENIYLDDDYLESNENFNSQVSIFLKQWKSIPSQNVLKYNKEIRGNLLTDKEINIDYKNSRITLFIDPYKAIILYDGHNFRNPLTDYINKISLEDSKGSMIFEKGYIDFPFSYDRDCDCQIWKIFN